jgi:hypothetical protein
MNLVRIIQQTSVLVSMVLASFLIYGKPVSAQQRVCVIADDGTTVCGKLITQTKKSIDSVQRKEIDKFVILLKGCRRSDANIKCNFIITNKGEERSLTIYTTNYTAFVDSSGVSYFGSRVDVGGQSNSNLSPVISPGIDYIADISFENIPQQITQVPLLNLVLNTPDLRTIKFRNVSFSN